MPRQRITITLDAEEITLLRRLAPSPHKQGELVGTLLRERARGVPVLDRLVELEREIARLREQVTAQETGDGRTD